MFFWGLIVAVYSVLDAVLLPPVHFFNVRFKMHYSKAVAACVALVVYDIVPFFYGHFFGCVRLRHFVNEFFLFKHSKKLPGIMPPAGL